MSRTSAAGRHPGSLADFKVLEREIQPHIKACGGNYPGQVYFRRKGLYRFNNAINNHHGGHDAVRVRLGFEARPNLEESLRDWATFVREIAPHVEANGGYYPGIKYFKDNGLHHFNNVISNHYKGHTAVRKKLGLKSKPPGFDTPKPKLADWDVFKKQLQSVEKKLSRQPERPQEIMRHIDYELGDANYFAKNYHGGWPNVFKRMGWKPSARGGRLKK